MSQDTAQFYYLQEVHGTLMSIAWFALQNMLVWSTYFKHNAYALYIHAACASLMCFITALGPMLMIAYVGNSVIVQSWYHQTWGFVLYLILPFLIISGSICLVRKYRSTVPPEQVKLSNKAHPIFGWVFIFLIKVPIITGWFGGLWQNCLLGFILLVDIISYGSFFYLKFFRTRIEGAPKLKQISKTNLRQIKSSKDLKIYSNDYFIFSNFVYSITPIIHSHPGGWKIIQSIKTRQVDRFLYGVDPIQIYDVPRVSHSLNSIDLAQQPIAVLALPKIYSVEQFNQARVASVTCHDKKMRIHTVYLELENEKASFGGYTDISQIGYYYAFSVESIKKTRLYTAVNFLQPANVQIITSISRGGIQLQKKPVQLYQKQQKTKTFQLDLQLIKNQQKSANTENSNNIPIMIKKYDDGQFTSKFLDPMSKIQKVIISEPRGLGLALDDIHSNNIVLFAGGTGLFPFSDLIDLLYKAKLVQQSHQMSNILQETDPILKKKPFQNLNFTLYLGVNDLDQLHPITLYQLNQLSSHRNFKCHTKIKGPDEQKLKQYYKNIQCIKDRFQKFVKKHFNQNQQKTAMFYVCGPVRFTRSLLQEFRNQSIPAEYYRIV